MDAAVALQATPSELRSLFMLLLRERDESSVTPMQLYDAFGDAMSLDIDVSVLPEARRDDVRRALLNLELARIADTERTSLEELALHPLRLATQRDIDEYVDAHHAAWRASRADAAAEAAAHAAVRRLGEELDGVADSVRRFTRRLRTFVGDGDGADDGPVARRGAAPSLRLATPADNLAAFQARLERMADFPEQLAVLHRVQSFFEPTADGAMRRRPIPDADAAPRPLYIDGPAGACCPHPLPTPSLRALHSHRICAQPLTYYVCTRCRHRPRKDVRDGCRH
jgi:hypothetical protein